MMLVMLMGAPISALADNDAEFNYEFENVKAADQAGFVVVKIWNYGRREKLTRNLCMRNAIEGVLFKGLSADGTGSTSNYPALVPGGYSSHKEYFDRFFESDYMQYIQLSNKGAMGAGDVIKISKKDYKIGMLVKINYNALRQRMEKDGIAASARSLFQR